MKRETKLGIVAIVVSTVVVLCGCMNTMESLNKNSTWQEIYQPSTNQAAEPARAAATVSAADSAAQAIEAEAAVDAQDENLPVTTKLPIVLGESKGAK